MAAAQDKCPERQRGALCGELWNGQIQYRRIISPTSEVTRPSSASASLDDGRRSNVSLVAYDQYSFNSVLTRCLDCLA
jgi:hypothetical protein